MAETIYAQRHGMTGMQNDPADTEHLAAGYARPSPEGVVERAMRLLPGFLSDALQTSGPLNRSVQAKAGRLSEQIAALRDDPSVSQDIKDLLLQVPTLRFADPVLPAPIVMREERSDILFQADIDDMGTHGGLDRADFRITLKVPGWRPVRLRGMDAITSGRITEAADLIEVGYQSHQVCIRVACLSSQVHVRALRANLDRLTLQGLRNVSQSTGLPGRDHILAVVDSDDGFNALVGRYDVVNIGHEMIDGFCLDRLKREIEHRTLRVANN